MNIEEVLLTFGGVIVLFGLFNLSRALISRRWPNTIGRIQRNEVKSITSNHLSQTRLDPLSSYSVNSNYGTSKEKVLGLSYVYAIDGYKYIGDRLYSAPIVKVRSQIGGLNVGDKVKVFYSPNNPHKSFLAHSFSWPSFIVIGLGFVPIVAAAYVHFNP